MSVTPPPAARLQAPRCSRRLGPPAQWARFRAAVRAATSARLAQLWALRGACPFSLPRNVPPFSGRGAGLQTGLIAPPSRGVRKSPQASGFGGFRLASTAVCSEGGTAHICGDRGPGTGTPEPAPSPRPFPASSCATCFGLGQAERALGPTRLHGKSPHRGAGPSSGPSQRPRRGSP